MKRFILFVLLLPLPISGAFAQAGGRLLSSDRQPVRISLGTTYQRYVDDGQTLTEWSVPFFAAVSLGDHLRVRFLSSLAVPGGGNLERTTGLNNARLALSYARRVGAGSIVANLGVSLPTGKQELTRGAFRTMRVLSRDIYSFRVPSLGQGLNISPSLTGAWPLSESVVVGLGLAYQYRGSYTPRRGMEAPYEPGDEFLVTGGLDLRLARTTALSGDLTYTFYGQDAIGEDAVYDAGDKLTATLQLLHTAGFNELRVVARYRGRAKSDVPLLAARSAAGGRRTLPNMVLLIGSYHLRLTPAFSLTALAKGRFFGETAALSRQTVADVGGVLTFRLTDQMRVMPRFLYTFGSFTGVEAGLGLDVRL